VSMGTPVGLLTSQSLIRVVGATTSRIQNADCRMKNPERPSGFQ